MLHYEVLFLGVVHHSRVPMSLGPQHSSFPLEFHRQGLNFTIFGQLQRHMARNRVPVGEGVRVVYGVVGDFEAFDGGRHGGAL